MLRRFALCVALTMMSCPPVLGFEPFSPHDARPRVLVTGGCGFVGGFLVPKLKRRFGGGTLKVVDNLWRGKLENLVGPDGPAVDLRRDVLVGDLTDPLVAARATRNADAVFHLADIVAGIDYVFGNQHSLFLQNMRINMNVIEHAQANGVSDFVYVGTACSFPAHLQGSYAPVAIPENLTYPANPESSYGWSKLMGEYELELARAPGTFNVGIVRFHNLYGPRIAYDPERSQALPSLIRKAIRAGDPAHSEPLVIWGSGRQYRDFLHVEDATDAVLATFERGMNRGAIQVGTGAATTLAQAGAVVAGLAKELLGKDVAFAVDPSKPEGDRGRVAELTRARSILGWEAKIRFQDGMREMFEWILGDMRAPAAPAPAPALEPTWGTCYGNQSPEAPAHVHWKTRSCRFRNLYYHRPSNQFYAANVSDTSRFAFAAAGVIRNLHSAHISSLSTPDPQPRAFIEANRIAPRPLAELPAAATRVPGVTALFASVYGPNIGHVIGDEIYAVFSLLWSFGHALDGSRVLKWVPDVPYWKTCDGSLERKKERTDICEYIDREVWPAFLGARVQKFGAFAGGLPGGSDWLVFEELVGGVGAHAEHCLDLSGHGRYRHIDECGMGRGAMFVRFRDSLLSRLGLGASLLARLPVFRITIAFRASRGGKVHSAWYEALKPLYNETALLDSRALIRLSFRQETELMARTCVFIGGSGGSTYMALFTPDGSTHIRVGRQHFDWHFFNNLPYIESYYVHLAESGPTPQETSDMLGVVAETRARMQSMGHFR